MSDHADTIRRALMYGDPSKYQGARAALDALLAERQQAIDERDEVIAALSRADERIAELVARCLVQPEPLTLPGLRAENEQLLAERQQAIDALRIAEPYVDARTQRGAEAARLVRAALVSLGETE